MGFPEKASELRALLTSRGLAPSRRFGQNFLIESRILDQITRLAELTPDDLVLEVGTGPGNLTHRVAEVARHVVTVEIDVGMHTLARDLLGNRTNVRLIHGDVLDTKSRLNPEVCEKLDVALVDNIVSFKVVANLPYNITTPFLSSLLLRYGAPDLMVLTVQKELAKTLVAKPSTKDYGALSIVMQLLAEITLERVVGPTCFWPKPRVDSAVVVVRSRGLDPLPVMRVHPLIQFLFRSRRKMMTNVLRQLPAELGGPFTPEIVAAVFEAADIDPKRRAETLEPSRFLDLGRAIADVSEGL